VSGEPGWLLLSARTASPAERAAGSIERPLALGARRVDAGQGGDESWTVLADPEATSSAWCARSAR
jgi:hypothetical protein